MERALIYIPSSKIVNFVASNPIDWGDEIKIGLGTIQIVLGQMAKRGSYGDQAGVTPTPAVEEFINLLIEKRGLFTQGEYMEHCLNVWDPWFSSKHYLQRLGVIAKLYRNFYPSMIDSLHVWSMLCESGSFDMCLLSATEDAIGKSDLVLRNGAKELRLALLGPTSRASDDRSYKIAHRNNGSADCIEVKMPFNYHKSPGNKRWFKEIDIVRAILWSKQLVNA